MKNETEKQMGEIVTKAKPRSFWISITQEMIDKAEPESSANCMNAVGIRERIPGSESIDVRDTHAKFNLDGVRYCYELSGENIKRVELFDKDRKLVQPYTLKLDARQCFVKPIRKRNKLSNKRKSPTNPHTPHCRRPVSRRRHGLSIIG